MDTRVTNNDREKKTPTKDLRCVTKVILPRNMDTIKEASEPKRNIGMIPEPIPNT